MRDPNSMTREELIEQAKKFTDFNGNPNPEYAGDGKLSPDYDGYGDSHIQFIGKESEGSFFNLNETEPFQLLITNYSTAIKTFYLSFGLNYPGPFANVNLTGGVINPLPAGMFAVTPAAVAAGGYFQAIEDALQAAVASYSLSISCPNSNQSLLKYVNFVRNNPTFSHIIQATTTNPIAQLAALVYDGKTGVIRDETLRTIPWRKYGDGDQYNLQFIDLKESIHMDDQNIVQIQVAGGTPITGGGVTPSTLSLNIYMSAADNAAARLRKRTDHAKKTLHKRRARGHNYDGSAVIR